MGKKKQARPRRSGKISKNFDSSELNLGNIANSETSETNNNEEKVGGSNTKPFFVDIDKTSWTTNDDHLDIAEVVVNDSMSKRGCFTHMFTEECCRDPKFFIRFRLSNIDKCESRVRLGHFPITSAENIFLEICKSEDTNDTEIVVFSGIFDGPNEGVSGLVHLVSQKILMVRPVKELRVSEDFISLAVRVEILKNGFNACESLLETIRKPWKRSMLSVMAWLRPEVTKTEEIYGIDKPFELEAHIEAGGVSNDLRQNTEFNASSFYAAIKPSKRELLLADELPDLLPELRPYQRRAVYWMVQREKAAPENLDLRNESQFARPLCVPVQFLETQTRMFYNPFSGSISLHPESSSPYVSGGILADEMGLGKTVELLACILAHQNPIFEGSTTLDDEIQVGTVRRSSLKRLRVERIECSCGAVSESPDYRGLWVQCDICDAWQHADCARYSPEGKTSGFQAAPKGRRHLKVASTKTQNPSRNKISSSVDEMNGNFICHLCKELIQSSQSPVITGATLIVCPTPIVQQWHAEITRHIKPGSLKICVYEGVRNATLSATPIMDISELVNADIVLTTYDVLKEDLSHDSDRHEGDCHRMRFKKRYPVIPTLLTKIFWWRICLDEAQMVESSVAAATEMALRLHGKYHWCITGTPIQRRLDDLYGLLRFLNASPFDVHKWWSAVIKDPYERKDAGAMQFAHKYFKQIMWRSSKADVADELQLPPQKECVSWLSFSPIELHFYQRQHETCVTYAHEVIQCFKDNIQIKIQDSESCKLSEDLFLTHTEASKLLNSLLKLRQACCHPQVGSSGLRPMQQAPMTMEEILEVLVGKSKIEGEEALRKLVVALNGLAGIAVIEQDPSRAVSMYREALSLAEEYSDDFRLDPLLNLHIHHNLVDLLPLGSNYSKECHTIGGELFEQAKMIQFGLHAVDEFEQYPLKRQKVIKDCPSDLTTDDGKSTEDRKQVMENDAEPGVSSKTCSVDSLRITCKNIQEKYLSVFISKLSLAQQEFRNLHMQVCNTFSNQQDQHICWWLEVLHQVEQSKDSSDELVRRVCEAVTGTLSSSKSSRIASRFQSVSGLKYLLQTGIDSVENSRQALLGRLLEINQTMDNPRNEDILRMRFCRNCQNNGDGPICVLCELDELFQEYEARLFRLTKGSDGGMIASAEEAVDLQKKKSQRNRFYWGLSQPKDASLSSSVSEKNKKQRDVGTNVVVSRSPSELEIVLGVIKNYSKAQFGRDVMLAANKHLSLFEAMRKEYDQARCLANAQAQTLRAHDEIKMATSRLRLRESENDTSLDALSSEELVATNVQFSHEKFMSLSSLSRIRGQHRYLKGMVLSRQKAQVDVPNSPTHLDAGDSSSVSPCTREQNQCRSKPEFEACPVCQEKITSQKMVFQCGHVTCCKCLIAIVERRLKYLGRARDKWVMCPTCRQHTDFENIAYADDRQSKTCDSGTQYASQGHEMLEVSTNGPGAGRKEMCSSGITCAFQGNEASINVQGSYGTKIEAVTRRILSIKSSDPKAKVLVFTSWNDVLDVLEHAFLANSISYIRMKGGRKSHVAIAQFKGRKSGPIGTGEIPDQEPEEKFVQVLLLLIQHGANGLNLLEAQHVILLEPLLNPAAEAQAINRVHRIGQSKRTLVHRFIVKDTVEESIYKLNRGRISSSIISGNTKNQDQPVLTLKDVESLLFSSVVSPLPLQENESIASGIPTPNLMHLPPAVAAAIAAERRSKEASA